LVSILTPEALRDALDRFRLDAAAVYRSATKRRAELHKLERLLRAAGDSEYEARVERNLAAVVDAKRKQDELRTRIANEREALGPIIDEEERLRQVGSLDAERVLATATNIRELIARARTVPGALRRLVAECVQCVYVQRLARSTYSVDIQFPTHVVVRRTLITASIRATDGESAYIAARMAVGIEPRLIAGEMNEALKVRRLGAPWHADRVRAVFLQRSCV
jgi:hypothetical protein